MFSVAVDMPECPGRPELVAACEMAVWANCRWYLAEWQAGRDPPCCLDCAGIKYRPDQPSKGVRIRTGAIVLKSGVASCGELAALEAGRRRAEALRDGWDPQQVDTIAWVELVAQDSETFHAVVRLVEGDTIDPSEGRPRG